jgi:serine/threonine-protein kinase HipA
LDIQLMLLQTYWDGRWHDAATLNFFGNGKDARVQIEYLLGYLQQTGVIFDSRCEQAVTVNAPVSVIEADYHRWPGLLDDLLPAGKTRQWWLQRLDISHLNVFEADCMLLAKTCMSPVGNVRVKDAVLAPDETATLRFPLETICRLEHDFLEYANSRGAAVGGATGAAGVAPKLLLMVDSNEVYIDGDFAGKQKTGRPYLVKFARNLRSERDNNILKAEAAYYRVLSKLLTNTGISTIDSTGLQLYDVDGHVSLWLPRFDVEEQNGYLHRLGMESVYSVIDAGPGSAWDHFDVVRVLWDRLGGLMTQSRQQFVTEYVIRDLLNLVFGNSDNHGRNMSFLKQNGKVSYAPIYDFAPMKADPEQVTRLFKWGRGAELAGEVNFAKVAEQLADWIDPEVLLSTLRQLAVQLLEVPALLAQADCPHEILNFPAIGFAYLPEKLTRMKLL